jgi:hypothetical protein
MGVTMLNAAPLCPFSGAAAAKPSKCGYRVIVPGGLFNGGRKERFSLRFSLI